MALAWADALDGGFQIVCGVFFAEYVLRLTAAPGAPGAGQRRKWRSRLAWAASIGGIRDFVGALPGGALVGDRDLDDHRLWRRHSANCGRARPGRYGHGQRHFRL
jgi:hypothetical protein